MKYEDAMYLQNHTLHIHINSWGDTQEKCGWCSDCPSAVKSVSVLLFQLYIIIHICKLTTTKIPFQSSNVAVADMQFILFEFHQNNYELTASLKTLILHSMNRWDIKEHT